MSDDSITVDPVAICRNKVYVKIPSGEIQIGLVTGRVGFWSKEEGYTELLPASPSTGKGLRRKGEG